MWEHDRLPVWFTVAVLAFLVVVALTRVSLVRTTRMDRLINKALALAVASALLREPAIARQVDALIPGGLPILFDLWHFLFVLACVLTVGMFLLWDRGIDGYQRPLRGLIVLACLLGVAFVVLSQPARQASVSVPDQGGWRYAAYFIAYTGLLAGVSVYILDSVRRLRNRTTLARERLVVVIMFALGLCGTVVMTAMGAGIVLDAAGVETAYTHWARVGASGEGLLPFVLAAAIALTPSAFRALTRLLRVDRSSRQLRKLRPLWRSLTSAAPEVVLRLELRDRWAFSPAARLHRCRVEILDAAAIVGRYVRPLPDAAEARIVALIADEDEQEAMRSVVELAEAARWLSEIGGTAAAGEPLFDSCILPEMETLEALWGSALRIVDEVGARREECPRAV
ncbi:DUF6545 domain-containing protein [Nocardia amamiensis]|uniref:DUF6545 domain-containing protein n=1 Tax=Nocardia amamiensis TaxID=404578 RepID=UPI00082E9895|nr:DUF6545 domain-containing protein [Nocardia amamiensis]